MQVTDDTSEVLAVGKSRLFSLSYDHEDIEVDRKRQEHDGIPLSRRKEQFSSSCFGLRAYGTERSSRKAPRNAISMQRPLSSDAQLKVSGASSRSSFRLSGQLLG